MKKEKYINAVVGPQSYHEINKIILDIENSNTKVNLTEFEVIEKFDHLNLVKNSNSKISSFLTIQEGCDKFCKFCVVPILEDQNILDRTQRLYLKQNNLLTTGHRKLFY